MDLHIIYLLIIFFASPLILSTPLGQFSLIVWFCGFASGISVLTIFGIAQKL